MPKNTRVMGLFFCSKAPGLVFSVTYPWGILAPLRIPPHKLGAAASPADKSRKGRRPPASHIRKAR